MRTQAKRKIPASSAQQDHSLKWRGVLPASFIPRGDGTFSAEFVGARHGIILGKKSALDRAALKAKELRLDVSAPQRPPVLAAVKSKGIALRRLERDSEFGTTSCKFVANNLSATDRAPRPAPFFRNAIPDFELSLTIE
jgi:hypothetical protein